VLRIRLRSRGAIVQLRRHKVLPGATIVEAFRSSGADRTVRRLVRNHDRPQCGVDASADPIARAHLRRYRAFAMSSACVWTPPVCHSRGLIAFWLHLTIPIGPARPGGNRRTNCSRRSLRQGDDSRDRHVIGGVAIVVLTACSAEPYRDAFWLPCGGLWRSCMRLLCDDMPNFGGMRAARGRQQQLSSGPCCGSAERFMQAVWRVTEIAIGILSADGNMR